MTMQALTADGQTADAREALTGILHRIRVELQEIASRIDRNQALIARTTWHHGMGDADYMQAMQDADLNAQRVAGSAGFLSDIALQADPQWQVDAEPALSRLTLSELARALRDHAPSSGDELSSGDVDLF